MLTRISRGLAMAVAVASAAALSVPAAPAVASSAGAGCPWLNPKLSVARRTDEVLSRMTLAEKISMVTGVGDATDPTSAAAEQAGLASPNPGAASTIAAQPSLCIPTLVLNDATNGIGDSQTGTTAFPDSIGLAASWDPGLAESYGRVLAQEALAKGVNVLLGPGVDVARNPLNGRNFEYMGEDPFLAGRSAAALIRGVQADHVLATVKHYALNDQETDRSTDSSDASERTMQEIDLPAFDMAVKAGVGAVMCSYNRINGVYACQNPHTLRSVLDDQFAFGGFVMSDWGATHSTVASVKAGLDMEMPAGQYYGSALQSAVQSGQVPPATLNRMVSRILSSMFRIGLFDHVPHEGAQAAGSTATTAASTAMATQVAQAGTVLLKDADGVLPLRGRAQRLAVIGAAASPQGATLAEQGYGSGHVPEFAYQAGVVSPLQAITARAAQAGDAVTYADGTVTAAAVAAAKTANEAIVFVNAVQIEGADRPSLDAQSGTCSFLDFASSNDCTYSPVDENALVSAVAAANPHTVVVIQSGDPVAMPWLNQVQGVLENWYPGQVDGDAIAPILFGDVDPSGKLPLTFPASLSEDPLRTAAQYPGVTKPGDSIGPHSSYSEGLLVGYRWYDAEHITPLFPFGFGLSYTSFRFSDLRVSSTGRGSATVRFRVSNVGARAGAEVAQVYLGMPRAAGEPPRQLKGFSRVSLAPGRSRTVAIPLPAVSFAHWSDSRRTWTVSAGRYTVWVGDSSASVDLPLHATLRRSARRLPAGAY